MGNRLALAGVAIVTAFATALATMWLMERIRYNPNEEGSVPEFLIRPLSVESKPLQDVLQLLVDSAEEIELEIHVCSDLLHEPVNLKTHEPTDWRPLLRGLALQVDGYLYLYKRHGGEGARPSILCTTATDSIEVTTISRR